MYMSILIHTCTYTRARAHTHTHTHTHHMQTHSHTHMHTFTHIHVCLNDVSPPVIMHCKTRPASVFSAPFPLIFLSLCVPASYCTHLNPSSCICMYLRASTPDLKKNDVRGNLPGHRTRKHVLFVYFCLCLPCFAVYPCPYTPPHP